MNAIVNRRAFLGLAGATAAGVGLETLTGCRTQSSGGTADTLKINSFGGTFQEAVEKVVVPAFEAKYDTTVSVTTAISTDALTKLKASPRNAPALDVPYMDLAPIYQAKAAGLLQPMDRSKIPHLADMYDLAVDPEGYWVAELVSMTGIAYNTEKVKTPPTSWHDLWDPKFEGRVAISDVAGTAGYQFLVQAARLNGGDESDIDPGFKALSRMKRNIATIYKAPDEMSQLLTSGEAWIGPWYGDRLSSLKRKGAPVAFVTPKEGAIAILSAVCIAKGTRQRAAAHNFINSQISARVNKKFITTIAEGPTNKSVQLDPKFLRENYIPYGPKAMSALVSLDSKTIARNLPDWISRWQSEIAN